MHLINSYHLSHFRSFHVVRSLFLRLIEEIVKQSGNILKEELIGISKYAAEVIAKFYYLSPFIFLNENFSHALVLLVPLKETYCKSVQISSD